MSRTVLRKCTGKHPRCQPLLHFSCLGAPCLYLGVSIHNQKDGILTAKKKSFLDKVATKTTNKLADKVASGIVRSITTKPKSRDSGNSTVAKSTSAKRGTAKKEAADKPDADTMAMRYNTKRCPECQALCFNSPAVCPYCDADLKSVKPLTPKEFDELSE